MIFHLYIKILKIIILSKITSLCTFTGTQLSPLFSAPSVGIFFGVFFSVNACQSFIVSHSNVKKTCITRKIYSKIKNSIIYRKFLPLGSQKRFLSDASYFSSFYDETSKI